MRSGQAGGSLKKISQPGIGEPRRRVVKLPMTAGPDSKAGGAPIQQKAMNNRTPVGRTEKIRKSQIWLSRGSFNLEDGPWSVKQNKDPQISKSNLTSNDYCSVRRQGWMMNSGGPLSSIA